jgi:phosphopantetheinyl transferase
MALAADRVGSFPSTTLVSPSPAVVLWRCELGHAYVAAEAEASLSTAELQRAGRFGGDALRARWIAGRLALRRALGGLLQVEPRAVQIVRGRRGRPQLGPAHPPIDFNLSHTGDVALIAAGTGLRPDERLGVDIEFADRSLDADRLARKFLTAGERGDIAAQDADGRRRGFLRRWTCKEAMSKATADALLAPFRDIDVECREGLVLRSGPPPYLPAQWTLHAVDAGAGMLAALAIWRMP